MRLLKKLAALLLAVLLLTGAGLQVSAAGISPLRAEEDEGEFDAEAEEAAEEGSFTADEEDPYVTLRGRNMVSDGKYVYYIPQEMMYDYTDYFGMYPADYEDGYPETRTLRRAALPLTEHPLDTEEVLYEAPCEWLCIGSDGLIYFCSYEENAIMSFDPETDELGIVYQSPYGYPPSAPYYRDGYLFFVEAGDLMRWTIGSDEEAELYFSAWDYSTVSDEEDVSFLWEVEDYEFVYDKLYINLSNTDSDYNEIHRLIAGPASYDDFEEGAEAGDGEEKSGKKGFFSGLMGSGKGENEEAAPDDENTEEEPEAYDYNGNGDEYLADCGFGVVARRCGRSMARYGSHLIYVCGIETYDEEEPYLKDAYGDYLYHVCTVDPVGNQRALSDAYDTRTMFVAGDYVYYDGYIEDDPRYADESGEPLAGRYIFVNSLTDPENEEDARARLFSDIDCPRMIIGLAGGWLWYEHYENNFWVNLEDIDFCYWMSYLDDEGEIEIGGDEDEGETEEPGFVPPENIPGDTGVYGPGTCDLRLDSDDQMAAFRLLRTDGTEQFFVILNANSTQTVTFPCGTYILKTAEGPYWISDTEAFGEDGIYSTTDWYVFEEGYEYFIESNGTSGDFDGDTQSGFLQ